MEPHEGTSDTSRVEPVGLAEQASTGETGPALVAPSASPVAASNAVALKADTAGASASDASAPHDVRSPVAEDAIWTEGLGKRFGERWAIEDMSFRVRKGIIFGFVGPSGSGKTTTIRVLTGVYTPTLGDVRVLGFEPNRFSSKVRRRLGYMPQLFVLYPDLTVLENLNFAASIYGLFRRRKRISELLDFVELKDERHKLARRLSGGMQRRLSLAATLIHDPDLLFLDEPTAGVDPVLRAKFWDHFRTLQNEGRTLFITTQYVAETEYCDYVGVMDGAGHLLALDTPNGLRHRAFGGERVQVHLARSLESAEMRALRALPSVKASIREDGNSGLSVVVDDAATAIPMLMEWFAAQNIDVESITPEAAPFDEAFVRLMQQASAPRPSQ